MPQIWAINIFPKNLHFCSLKRDHVIQRKIETRNGDTSKAASRYLGAVKGTNSASERGKRIKE